MLWPFDYQSPSSEQELLALVTKNPQAAILAGGTDLLVDMRAGIQRPDMVIDIKQIPELKRLELRTDGTLVIGAAVSLSQLAESELQPYQAIKQAALSIATYQIRNRATAAGNICHASPSADMGPALCALQAVVIVKGNEEQRLPLCDFMIGVKMTALKPGQWVDSFEIPPQAKDLHTAFYKKMRIRGHDLAGVNVAIACSKAEKSCFVSVGACAITPLFFDMSKQYAKCNEPQQLANAVNELVGKSIKPITDNRASAEYRKEMVKYFIEKAIVEATA